MVASTINLQVFWILYVVISTVMASYYATQRHILHTYHRHEETGNKGRRKGGPGITQSDLLVINKIDLAEAVGASLEVMEQDASKMRKGMELDGESGPTVFASVKNGDGVDEIIRNILKAFEDAHKLAKDAE